jgi:hypothetical protein
MKTSLIVRVGYGDIFGRKAKKPKSENLLRQLHLESSLELMVVLNKYEGKLRKEDPSEIQFILHDWLVDAEPGIKTRVLQCFSSLSRKHSSRETPTLKQVSVVNRMSTLRVMELLIAESELRPLPLKAAGTSNGELLFLLYLLVNDELEQRQDVPFQKYLKTRHINGHETRLHLHIGLMQADMAEEPASKKLFAGAFTFILLERWLKSKAAYEPIFSEYLRSLGCVGWWELFTKIFRVNSIVLQQHKILKDLYPELIVVLDYFSSHREGKLQWQELAGLRKNPLYKTNEGDYLVLDFSYMLDKFFAGLYHDLVLVSSGNGPNKFHLDYSKDFMEDVLLSAALKSCFGKSYIQFSESSILSRGSKGVGSLALPDFYVRNGNKVLLFECKNSFLSHDSKISLDVERIENEIADKFVGTGVKRKAVRQLLNFIENSDCGKYSFFDKVKNLSNLIYFPILVVSDPTLTVMGFNALLSEHMLNYSATVPVKLQKRIKPLTVIHINDFLYYTKDLKKLDAVILSYHEFLKGRKVPDNTVSFSTYLDHHKFEGKRNIQKADILHIIEPET